MSVMPHIVEVNTVQELAVILNKHPHIPLLGGGTLAIPDWERQGSPLEAIYLPMIEELRRLGADWCGAAVTLSEIARQTSFPLVLREAAASIGGPGIRNIATLGGNLAALNTGCLAVALLVLDAIVDNLPGDPYLLPQSQRLPEVIHNYPFRRPILRVHWKRQTHYHTAFYKVGIHIGGGPNMAAVAVRWDGAENAERCAIAVGATGKSPHRLAQAEQEWGNWSHRPEFAAKITGEIAAQEALVEDENPEIVAYKRHLIGVIVECTLLKLVHQHGEENKRDD